MNQNADAFSQLNHRAPNAHISLSIRAISCLVVILADTNTFQAQHADPLILKVIELKEQGFPMPSSFARRKNQNLCSFLHCWDQLRVSNDILMKVLVSKHGFVWEMFINPDALVPTILQSLHNGPSGRHMGTRRTIMRYKDRFFWPRLNNPVIQFIQTCTQCSQRKSGTRRVRAPLQSIEFSEPFVF